MLLRVFDINAWALLTATLEQVCVPLLVRSTEPLEFIGFTHLTDAVTKLDLLTLFVCLAFRHLNQFHNPMIR